METKIKIMETKTINAAIQRIGLKTVDVVDTDQGVVKKGCIFEYEEQYEKFVKIIGIKAYKYGSFVKISKKADENVYTLYARYSNLEDFRNSVENFIFSPFAYYCETFEELKKFISKKRTRSKEVLKKPFIAGYYRNFDGCLIIGREDFKYNCTKYNSSINESIFFGYVWLNV